jgi:Flp pilus assembly pilin Flp
VPGVKVSQYMYRFVMEFQDLLTRLIRHDDRGATAVEYGLILVAIAATIALAVKALGPHVAKAFTVVSGDF